MSEKSRSSVVSAKSNFQIGWDSALEELETGEIELKTAFLSFRTDIPDRDWEKKLLICAK